MSTDMPIRTSHHTIPFLHGHSLSALAYHRPSPSTPARTRRLAILAHPYPPLNGHKQDHVIVLLAQILASLGFVVVTFDFGRPTTWTGERERAEFECVMQWGIKQEKEEETVDVVLGGYSFGSMIAASIHPTSPSLDTMRVRYLLVSPLRPLLAHFLTLGHVPPLPSQPSTTTTTTTTLKIWGSKDWMAHKTTPGEVQGLKTVEVRGAGHFWVEEGVEEELVRVVREWIVK